MFYKNDPKAKEAGRKGGLKSKGGFTHMSKEKLRKISRKAQKKSVAARKANQRAKAKADFDKAVDKTKIMRSYLL